MYQLFAIFLNVLTPVFLLVVVGYLAAPRLQLEARTMSKVSYYILTPAFIFNIFSTASIEVSIALRMGFFVITATTGCVLVALVVARYLRRSAAITAAFVLVTAFGNVGNFGLPIIQFRLGEEALVTASFYFLMLSSYGFIVGVMAATWHQGSRWNALWSVLKTPAILAVVPAVSVNLLDIQPPVFVQRAVGLLAAAMIPIMLLTLGVQLSGMRRPTIGRDVVVASSIRLVVGPILAVALATLFGLSGIERGAGILQVSMPSAVLAALVALEHNLVPDFVTTTVLFSTLASAVTLTIVLAFL